jgi:hypothetical protein
MDSRAEIRLAADHLAAMNYLLVLYVIQSLLEKMGNVVVIDRIIHLATFFAGAYDAHLTQSMQLVGDSRFTHPQTVYQGAHIQLFTFQQSRQDAHPVCIAKGGE